ncbi:MAG: hypothetical protein V3V00_16130 [Saprospiraceae bacterium]
MIEILIATIIGNLIVLGLSVGILAIYFRKKAQQLGNNESELPIQDIFSEFLLQSQDVFRKELQSESVQMLITSSVMEGVTALFSDEKNQNTLTNYITDVFQESLSSIIPQITGSQPLTATEIKKMDKKTDTALGAMAVNTIAESLPPGYAFLLDKVYPNWQEDAQKNPRDFVALISKANEWGLFNLIPGINQGTPSTTQTRSRGGF